MATNGKLKKRKSLPPKPRAPKPPKVSKNGTTKRKISKPKKPTPPTPTSPSKPKKPPNLKSPHKPPPTPPHKPKKSKKRVPPPPINRIKSRSTIRPSLPRQQSHSTITMKNKKKKPPPKRTKSLTKKHKNKKKRKCKRPPRAPPPPIKPIFHHPTIGEFYSKRTHKKQLRARKLPSKPKDVSIYFILMAKIYPYTISICLQHKLSQILAKLSSMLAGNEEILALITRELGRNDRDRSLSSISKKINKINSKNVETKTYDQVIRDPIFIYKNQTCNASDTFIQIGYKRDLDKIDYEDIITNKECKNKQQNTTETPFIVILSCTKKENDPFQMLSPKSPDLPPVNGHSRSKTHNDIATTSNFIGFNALSSVLHLQRDHKSRYKDLKKCVENLGYTLSLGVTKQQLICYVNKSIEQLRTATMARMASMPCAAYIDVDDNHLNPNKKPRRKRSRSWGGLPPPDMQTHRRHHKNGKKKEQKRKKTHKRYNQSVPDMQCDMICLQLSATNPTKLEFNAPKPFTAIESKFSRILRNSISRKKNSESYSDVEGDAADKYVKKSSSLQSLKSLIQRKLSFSDKESKTESDDDSENEVSYTNELQQSSNKEIEYQPKLPSLSNYSRQKERKRKKKKIKQEIKAYAYYSDNDTKCKKKRKKKVIKVIKGNTKTYEIKLRKYREQKEAKVSKVPITRRRSNKNKNKASIIVEGYLNTNIGKESDIKWEKYYYTFNRDRLLCWYLNKHSCESSEGIGKLSLMHGRCSFKINSNAIIVTIKTPKKPIIKHFRGTTSSLEKWKRAFLF